MHKIQSTKQRTKPNTKKMKIRTAQQKCGREICKVVLVNNTLYSVPCPCIMYFYMYHVPYHAQCTITKYFKSQLSEKDGAIINYNEK